MKPGNIDNLIKAGITIKKEFNKRFDLIHPIDSNISKKLLGVSFIDSPIKNQNANQNNIVVEGELFLDRPRSAQEALYHHYKTVAEEVNIRLFV